MPSMRTPRRLWNPRTRGERLLAEVAIDCDGVTTLRETLLEVADRVAAITDAQECVGRAQAINLKR